MVFHDHGSHVFSRWLRKGFRHVFVAVRVGKYWIRVDGMAGVPAVAVVAPAEYDLATFYRAEGYTVVSCRRGSETPWLGWVFANCVGQAKMVLGLRAPLAWTPWALHRRLTR